MDWHAATSLHCPVCHAPVASESVRGTILQCPHCGKELLPIHSIWRVWVKFGIGLAGGLVLGWRQYGWPSTFAGFVFFMLFALPTYVLIAHFSSAFLFGFVFNLLFPPRGLKARFSPVGGVLGIGPGN